MLKEIFVCKHFVELPEIETYTCLLPWRLGLGALPVDGRPNSESRTSSRVVELGEGFNVEPLVVRRVTSKEKWDWLNKEIVFFVITAVNI